MYVPNKLNYQPSPSTLTKWLKIRKKDFYIGGNKKESLFNQPDNSSDTTMAILVLIFEFLGMIATIYAASRGGMFYLLISMGGVILFTLFDFIIAIYGLHRKKADLAYGSAYYPTIKEHNQRQNCENNLEKLKKFDIIDLALITLLLIFALIKSAAIYWLGAIFPNPVIFLFIFMYFLIVLLHINNTGYAYYTWQTQKSLNKESKYPSKYPAEETTIQFKTTSELKLPVKIKGFEITKDDTINTDGNSNNYEIKGKGLLTDDDAKRLATIEGQTDENIKNIIDACRLFQLQNSGVNSNACQTND